MISGSTHVLSQNMLQSLQGYSTHLQDQRSIQSSETSDAHPEGTNKLDVPTENTPNTQVPINTEDPAILASQEARDAARKTALEVGAMKHRQNLVNTYIDQSTKDDDNDSPSPFVEPTDAYKASLKYARRSGLIDAFEKATEPQKSGMKVDIVI
ncbi:MAG: hypothetical protein COA99_16590 [Moraxellaceae bacterium]|nr:MAG: hypothetical protein COA99_16590 [Moraxellaceae bacterium]